MPSIPSDVLPKVRRPRLLLLAWNFPPVQAIASVRTWNIAKYLSRLGWDVTVVTPRLELWRHLDYPEKTKAALQTERIQRILTDHDWRFLTPIHLNCSDQGLGWLAGGVCRKLARGAGIDDGIGWIKPAERACATLKPDDVDLVFASGPPFATFMLAERLAKKLGRPYVLDYRDPWPGGQAMVEALRVFPTEGRLLKGAAAVTIVSQTWAADLDSRFNIGSKLHVVTNGYDAEELCNVQPYDFGHFAIVYAGIFYPPERVITPILEALKLLEQNDGSDRWYFHYYGHDEQYVRQQAAMLGVSNRVKVHGR